MTIARTPETARFGAAVSLYTQAETLADLVQRAYSAVVAVNEIKDELPLLSETGEGDLQHAVTVVVNELLTFDPDELSGALFAVQDLRIIAKEQEELAERELIGRGDNG